MSCNLHEWSSYKDYGKKISVVHQPAGLIECLQGTRHHSRLWGCTEIVPET